MKAQRNDTQPNRLGVVAYDLALVLLLQQKDRASGQTRDDNAHDGIDPCSAGAGAGQIKALGVYLLINKKSSMLRPKNLATLNASRMDGLYRPFSSEMMLCRLTPIAAVHSSCRTPSSLRSCSK